MKIVLFGFLAVMAAMVAMSSGCAELQGLEGGNDGDDKFAVEMPEGMAPLTVA